MKEMLKGQLVWLFGGVFLAFILCFISKDMPNQTSAGWFVTVVGSVAAFVLQAWHHKKYATPKFNWLNVGIAVVVMIFAGIIRAFAE